MELMGFYFFFSSRRRHTRLQGDWSSDVCSSDLPGPCACVPELTVPGFAHASRNAAAPGSARDAAADRFKTSLLVMPAPQAGRSFGCLAIAAHTLSPTSRPLETSHLDWQVNGILV